MSEDSCAAKRQRVSSFNTDSGHARRLRKTEPRFPSLSYTLRTEKGESLTIAYGQARVRNIAQHDRLGTEDGRAPEGDFRPDAGQARGWPVRPEPDHHV
jgi:hypothetical protein